ncbi:hypothetical protein ACIO52_15790 [Nocardia sp. NPDC087230]|uniref:hypothetical protein n=1 Tax=Nocardia sp. NPDC087230 TaxID=3364331 RepID=UPI0037F53B84
MPSSVTSSHTTSSAATVRAFACRTTLLTAVPQPARDPVAVDSTVVRTPVTGPFARSGRVSTGPRSAIETESGSWSGGSETRVPIR